ncbi:hypothetical protein [Desulfosarcina cetonica]|uniref:hypothetical protein n=1 Tax=Desulfosarcina cetonica TaxID=90730 RepID=UPI001FEF1EDF|nr:hypothetical protein [Desulfosarcina cetonica]
MDQTAALAPTGGIFSRIGRFFKPVPLMGYLIGFLVCVFWEKMAGEGLSAMLGLPKMPILFGIVTIFKVVAGMVNLLIKGDAFNWVTLIQIPMALVYFSVTYLIPLALICRLAAKPANVLAGYLQRFPLIVSA